MKKSHQEKIPRKKLSHPKFFPFSFCDFLSWFFWWWLGRKRKGEDKCQNKFYLRSFTLQFVRVNYHSWYLVYKLRIYLNVMTILFFEECFENQSMSNLYFSYKNSGQAEATLECMDLCFQACTKRQFYMSLLIKCKT